MTTGEREIIHSVAHLRQLIRGGRHDFSILLAGGLVRSRKTLRETRDGRFRIVHHIDGSTETLTAAELRKSNIGAAITKKRLIAD